MSIISIIVDGSEILSYAVIGDGDKAMSAGLVAVLSNLGICW